MSEGSEAKRSETKGEQIMKKIARFNLLIMAVFKHLRKKGIQEVFVSEEDIALHINGK